MRILKWEKSNILVSSEIMHIPESLGWSVSSTGTWSFFTCNWRETVLASLPCRMMTFQPVPVPDLSLFVDMSGFLPVPRSMPMMSYYATGFSKDPRMPAKTAGSQEGSQHAAVCHKARLLSKHNASTSRITSSCLKHCFRARSTEGRPASILCYQACRVENWSHFLTWPSVWVGQTTVLLTLSCLSNLKKQASSERYLDRKGTKTERLWSSVREISTLNLHSGWTVAHVVWPLWHNLSNCGWWRGTASYRDIQSS